MDDADLAVKHFLVCRRIVTSSPASGSRYTLLDVAYEYEIPPNREWPIRAEELWVFVRFYSGVGTRTFSLSVAWIDAPGEDEQDLAYFTITVRYPLGTSVLDRGWNISAVQFPGPGRYVFRLLEAETDEVLADDFIQLRRSL